MSARIVAALAAAWTALLWLAWFGDNPLYLHRLWPAVREYSLIRPWPALLAGAGRIPLFAALAVFFLASDR